MPSLLALFLLLSFPAAAEAETKNVERGRYLASIMDCGGCHTRGVLLGQPNLDLYLAGSEVGFHLPGLGYYYPSNLTSDPKTGLGSWSEDDIIRAVRLGVRPDGRTLAPVMPYHSYSALTDEDAYALASFIKSLRPIPYPEEPQPTPEGAKAPAPYLDVISPK
jgi:mono/diheme cytochrome c family protein